MAGVAISLLPLHGLPLLRDGDDLAQEIGDALTRDGVVPQDGDVVVVAQKAVSKVEGRAIALVGVQPSAAAEALAQVTGKPAALLELVLAEASEVIRARRGLVIVRHRNGQVAANAGIDASNVAAPGGGETVLLWPVSADDSARRLRQALQARFGVRLAVIVSDSLGRAWRMGTIGTAIGCAGLHPLRDRRGETDLYGRVLQATLTGVADEIAAAASLVMGEGAEGRPAVLVRGAVYTPDEEAGIGPLLRPQSEDLFR